MRRGLLIGLCAGILVGGSGYAVSSGAARGLEASPACAEINGNLGWEVRIEREAAKTLRADVARLQKEVAFLSRVMDKRQQSRAENE